MNMYETFFHRWMNPWEAPFTLFLEFLLSAVLLNGKKGISLADIFENWIVLLAQRCDFLIRLNHAET